jgi:uncharacterized membrane protein YoaK (UPF0700 family)
MLRIHPQRERSLGEHAFVATVLSLVAGAVNASGLLAAGAMTSHMTGNLSQGLSAEPAKAIEPAVLIACFFLGAFAAALIASMLLRRGLEPVRALLLVEAALLIGTAIPRWPEVHAGLVTGLLCFAMGWQNSIITKVSRAVVRTTHITGTLTDLGIEAAHLLLQRGHPADAKRALDTDLGRAALHATILVMFFVGAVASPLLYRRCGYRALLLPAALLALLVAVDRWRAARR